MREAGAAPPVHRPGRWADLHPRPCAPPCPWSCLLPSATGSRRWPAVTKPRTRHASGQRSYSCGTRSRQRPDRRRNPPARGHRAPLPRPIRDRPARLPALADRKRSGRPPTFTALRIAEVKASACQLPNESGTALPPVLPRSRARGHHSGHHRDDLRLHGAPLAQGDALNPWQHRSWIFIRDPNFRAAAQQIPGPVRPEAVIGTGVTLQQGAHHLFRPGARTR